MRKLLKNAQELNVTFFAIAITSMAFYYFHTVLNCTLSDLIRIAAEFGVLGWLMTWIIEIIIKRHLKKEKKEDQNAR